MGCRSARRLRKKAAATADDVLRVAVLALRHRLRKDPLETASDEHRIQRPIDDMRSRYAAG